MLDDHLADSMLTRMVQASDLTAPHPLLSLSNVAVAEVRLTRSNHWLVVIIDS